MLFGLSSPKPGRHRVKGAALQAEEDTGRTLAHCGAFLPDTPRKQRLKNADRGVLSLSQRLGRSPCTDVIGKACFEDENLSKRIPSTSHFHTVPTENGGNSAPIKKTKKRESKRSAARHVSPSLTLPGETSEEFSKASFMAFDSDFDAFILSGSGGIPQASVSNSSSGVVPFDPLIKPTSTRGDPLDSLNPFAYMSFESPNATRGDIYGPPGVTQNVLESSQQQSAITVDRNGKLMVPTYEGILLSPLDAPHKDLSIPSTSIENATVGGTMRRAEMIHDINVRRLVEGMKASGIDDPLFDYTKQETPTVEFADEIVQDSGDIGQVVQNAGSNTRVVEFADEIVQDSGDFGQAIQNAGSNERVGDAMKSKDNFVYFGEATQGAKNVDTRLANTHTGNPGGAQNQIQNIKKDIPKDNLLESGFDPFYAASTSVAPALVSKKAVEPLFPEDM